MTIVLPGWSCPTCRAFNGEAVQRYEACRACGERRTVEYVFDEVSGIDDETYREIRSLMASCELCEGEGCAWCRLWGPL